MQASFIRSATRILSEGVGAALAQGVAGRDYRTALCRWEDDLFRRFPLGHGIIAQHEAAGLIETIFDACGRKIPVTASARVSGHRGGVKEGNVLPPYLPVIDPAGRAGSLLQRVAFVTPP